MLCLISLIFVFVVVGQLESEVITLGQTVIYGGYGLLMFWYTSKKYGNYKEDTKKGGR